jgi:LmbE family N-acetylglucosaminyl deacetylase
VSAPGFTHTEDGTSEARWRAARLDRLPALAHPAAGQSVLVVAAHPDDEALGAGGLVAAAAAAGAAVTVAIATDGEASHPDSPTRTPQQLSRIRRREARDAVAALAEGSPAGIRLELLGLPDGGLADSRDALAASLGRIGSRPDIVVAPWIGDRHPDHAAAASAAAQLADRIGAELWQYPIWAWHWAEPAAADLPRGRARILPLDGPAQAAKANAIACYVSQHSPLSERPGDEAIVSPAMLAHFDRPWETYIVRAPAERPAYFDELYGAADDPWGLGERWYEQRKRDLIMASLPRRRYRRGFEPGCALGMLTERLAARCNEVVAWDVAERAVQSTREAMARADAGARVEVALGAIPQQWPEGDFDLIALSEVGYYCADLSALAARVRASLSGDGTVVACHWRRPAADHPHTAEAVHRALAAGLHLIAHHDEPDFLLDVFSRDPRSVAQRDGIVS